VNTEYLNIEESNFCYNDFVTCKCNLLVLTVSMFVGRTYKSMAGGDVEDGLDVAGVNEVVIIVLHFHSNTCIARCYYLN